MSEQRVRVLVVGVGALGKHHARILSGIDGVDLIAVADPRPEIGQAVARSCNTRWVADYSELLTEVDAVSVVVPTGAHHQVALTCLRHGVDVLIEKPLASDRNQGVEIVEAAEDRDAILQVGHIERFNPAFIELQKACHSPRYIRAERLSPYAFRSMDIGAVHDLMIHDIDLVLALARSPVARIEAFGMSLVGGREDAVQARLVFRNGCIADLVANRVSPRTNRTLQAWSESGWCHADLAARKVQTIAPSAELKSGALPFDLAMSNPSDIDQMKAEMFTRFFTSKEQTAETRDQLTDELTHFVDCVRRRTQPIVSGLEGLQALEVADAIVECVRQHQWDGHAKGRVGPNLLTAPPRRAAA